MLASGSSSSGRHSDDLYGVRTLYTPTSYLNIFGGPFILIVMYYRLRPQLMNDACWTA